MKKLFAAALLALAVPALAGAEEAKPADKSAKKAPEKKDDKKADAKKADNAAAPKK